MLLLAALLSVPPNQAPPPPVHGFDRKIGCTPVCKNTTVTTATTNENRPSGRERSLPVATAYPCHLTQQQQYYEYRCTTAHNIGQAPAGHSRDQATPSWSYMHNRVGPRLQQLSICNLELCRSSRPPPFFLSFLHVLNEPCCCIELGLYIEFYQQSPSSIPLSIAPYIVSGIYAWKVLQPVTSIASLWQNLATTPVQRTTAHDMLF